MSGPRVRAESSAPVEADRGGAAYACGDVAVGRGKINPAEPLDLHLTTINELIGTLTTVDYRMLDKTR